MKTKALSLLCCLFMLCGFFLTGSCSDPDHSEEKVTEQAPTEQADSSQEFLEEQLPEVKKEPRPTIEIRLYKTTPGCSFRTFCLKDSECKKGETCVGGDCVKKDDCPDNIKCDCKKDADCKDASLICHLGACERLGCFDDCDCASGTICKEQACVACEATCSDDTDCSEKEFCSRFAGTCSACKPKGAVDVGDSCRSDKDCKDGFCFVTTPSAQIGVCTRVCSKVSDCPGSYKCVEYKKELCNQKPCNLCLPGEKIGCSSLKSCTKDSDCEDMPTVCSCCKTWRCNTNNRCHPVFDPKTN